MDDPVNVVLNEAAKRIQSLEAELAELAELWALKAKVHWPIIGHGGSVWISSTSRLDSAADLLAWLREASDD